jgi:hypothetical protein
VYEGARRVRKLYVLELVVVNAFMLQNRCNYLIPHVLPQVYAQPSPNMTAVIEIQEPMLMMLCLCSRRSSPPSSETFVVYDGKALGGRP